MPILPISPVIRCNIPRAKDVKRSVSHLPFSLNLTPYYRLDFATRLKFESGPQCRSVYFVWRQATYKIGGNRLLKIPMWIAKYTAVCSKSKNECDSFDFSSFISRAHDQCVLLPGVNLENLLSCIGSCHFILISAVFLLLSRSCHRITSPNSNCQVELT